MNAADIPSLMSSLLQGDSSESVAKAKCLIESGVQAENIVVGGIEAAMSQLDAKCTLEQFNLLEIMMVGRAVMEVIKYLYPNNSDVPGTKGRVVIAVLEGDVHDIGKNILKTILITKGYEVIDCGKNCPLSKLTDVIWHEKPIAVGISGLVSTVIPSVVKVRTLLHERGLKGVKVIAGGAALKQSSPEKLNVDYVAETAFDSVRYLEQIFGGNN